MWFGALQAHMEAEGTALVVIDPLMAFLDARINAHADQDIRSVLGKFAALAEATGATILVVRHMNKRAGRSAMYRGGGSIGNIGAARVALLAAKSQTEEGRCVLAVTKCNLSAHAPSLYYEVKDVSDLGVARIAWGGKHLIPRMNSCRSLSRGAMRPKWRKPRASSRQTLQTARCMPLSLNRLQRIME